MTRAVAVRALCEFTAREGDLDLRFTPSPSALEGIVGHQRVSERRGPDYRSEVPLAGSHQGLQVRGRADGFDPVRQCLEEIKTHRGDLSRQPANHRALHWAQAKVYAALICASEGLASLKVALVYWHVDLERETRFEVELTAQALQAFFQQQCDAYLAWAASEEMHGAARNAALEGLEFPYAVMRPGQRATNGTRWPPSQASDFWPRRPPVARWGTPARMDRAMSSTPWTLSRTPGRDSSTPSRSTAIRWVSRPTRASSSVTRGRSWSSFDAATHRCRAARNRGPV